MVLPESDSEMLRRQTQSTQISAPACRGRGSRMQDQPTDQQAVPKSGVEA